jgi:transcription elongation factor
VAVEQALAIELAESGEELVAEHGAQCRNRQQEQRVAGRDPSPVVGRQSTVGDDAVEVIMAEQVLAPGVQNGVESDLGSEPFGSAATSSRVWELAANSRSKKCAGVVSASGFSS